MRLTEYLKQKITNEERSKILAQMQKEEESQGSILPFPSLWLRKYRRFLETGGAIVLGLTLAMLTVILNFLFYVKMLHIEL